MESMRTKAQQPARSCLASVYSSQLPTNDGHEKSEVHALSETQKLVLLPGADWPSCLCAGKEDIRRSEATVSAK